MFFGTRRGPHLNKEYKKNTQKSHADWFGQQKISVFFFFLYFNVTLRERTMAIIHNRTQRSVRTIYINFAYIYVGLYLNPYDFHCMHIYGLFHLYNLLRNFNFNSKLCAYGTRLDDDGAIAMPSYMMMMMPKRYVCVCGQIFAAQLEAKWPKEFNWFNFSHCHDNVKG